MYVKADDLGYRELDRLGKFLQDVGESTPLGHAFQELVRFYDEIGVSYDIFADDIKIICKSQDHIQMLHPADLI